MATVSSSINPTDFKHISETIIDEHAERRQRRRHLERHWREIDRQVAMIPERSHKQTPNGRIDSARAWMPETETPLQAQTLEMLTADTRRLMFPKNRDWFACRAALNEDYLKRFEAAETLFVGERGKDDRTILIQDNADLLAQGILSHWHNQYDFRAHVDLIRANAISYSFGVGRLRMVNRDILGHQMRGKITSRKIPVLIPRSPKNVYLDDSQHALMHEGESLGPNIIQVRMMRLADLQAAARDDKSYVPSEVNKLKADKHGVVTLLEMEGDLTFDRGTELVIVKHAIITVAKGSGRSKDNFGVVRMQDGEPFSTYLIDHYNRENAVDAHGRSASSGSFSRSSDKENFAGAYGSSPLLKGFPIAKAAAQALNRVIEASQLKNSPPIGYNRDDVAFANSGGPNPQPYAQWPTTDDVKVHSDIGGEPASLFSVFASLVSMYHDVTGVNPPRLGAQTKSHTTAFAKDVEITQGTIRTVDYINSSLEGPFTRFLELEYRMGVAAMTGVETVYIEDWKEFVNIRKAHLPDIVRFLAIGAGAPAEEQAKDQQRLASAQLALQIEAAALQLGVLEQPVMNYENLIKQTLSDGGWTDVSAIFEPSAASEGAPGQPRVAELPQVPTVVGGVTPSLESIG